MKNLKLLNEEVLRKNSPELPDEEINKAIKKFKYYEEQPNDIFMLYSEDYAKEKGYI